MTARPCYLDASVLVNLAERRAQSMPFEAYRKGICLDWYLREPQLKLATSELGLLEASSVLATFVRTGNVEKMKDCTDEWFTASRSELHTLIRDGRLTVLPTAPNAYRRADQLLDEAARMTPQPPKVKAWDAVHLHQAASWARELGETVTLIASDSDFAAMLRIWPAYARFVTVHNLSDAATRWDTI